VGQGEPIDRLRSVASFFVSRVDTKADAQLEAGSPLRGRVAIANAQLAYARYRARFASQRWARLARHGAGPQRPLWASTGTKDPAYSDVVYVERLVAPEVINTMPEQTLRAFAEHGTVGPVLDTDPAAAEHVLAAAAVVGVDLPAITAELEREGVQSFADSYTELVRCIEYKRAQIAKDL
jgi:transaldolase